MATRYQTVTDLLNSAFTQFPNHPAFTCAGHTLTFADVDRLSNQFASYLKNDLALQAGDRVAIQLPNILQYPVVLYGIIRAGLIVVSANPLYTPREIKHQLTDSGAKVLVVLSNVADNAAEIIDETEVEHVVVTNFADLHPAPKRQIINFVVKHVKKLVPKFSFKNAVKFNDIFKGEAKSYTTQTFQPNDIFALQYTGGTTGVSKGAMLSHNNMASNVWQLIENIPSAFDSGETLVACLPFYHIYALNIHALASFSRGGHNVLIPNPRDLDAFVGALKDLQFSVFVGINTLYTALCRHEGFKQLDFSKLKVACAGGMALTVQAAEDWKSLTGVDVCEGYGLTETSPVVTGNTYQDIRIGTIGRPLPETEIKIVDAEGNALPINEPGEICVKGPQVMLGYWERPEETAKTIDAQGWLHTGDIAQVDEEGFVKIVDRKKDMILVSGFNVYPNEVEHVAASHPKIIESAAIGVPNEKTGESVRLYVVATESSVDTDELMKFFRDNLTAYKVPKEIIFKESLPKSNVGKILRRELREAI